MFTKISDKAIPAVSPEVEELMTAKDLESLLTISKETICRYVASYNDK